ncbi:DUF3883 domain-containing protein [Microbacterium sp. H1-D42]|uniref:protein NO VEIN domain-containing protein n=1 Tax=Microbacterium sp. H1-D42 TaxID=2925844 RepID=UPI001F537659|nr:DUF3883 domain-containing protein [Microbacterium sp. H1-D42]UNK71732.1 DUF3883 domain-containing protein [Microbacterium sp. H1-D42]
MAINNWWDSDSSEIYWMEIRQEPVGLGDYLRAPKIAGDGNPSWSYELVSYVQPGDRVFHWHRTSTGEPGILGWSEATGPLETITWSWQARGTRGRERGVPTVGPTWDMPLTRYTELDSPVTRSALNARRADVLSVIEDVARIYGKPVYAPFQNYGGRELRAQQGYLTKFPAALVSLLFDLPAVGEADAPATRKRTARTGRGQGYLADAEKRTALERHAVRIAIDHYRAAGATSIEELGKPYDLRVILDGVERHIEVKGSVGQDLESVQLTQGEVEHARSYQPTDLFVVDGISATRGDGGKVETSGGNVRIWAEWAPSDKALRPTHLRYSLPSS